MVSPSLENFDLTKQRGREAKASPLQDGPLFMLDHWQNTSTKSDSISSPLSTQ